MTDYNEKKRGRYIIKDKFVNFWFKFIYPNLSFIEEGIYEFEIEKYEKEYLPFVFEEIGREYVKDVYKEKARRVWYKDVEIDIVGDKIAGEVKWSDNVDPSKLLSELEGKVKRLNIPAKKYVLITKSFSKKKLRMLS
ncbi:hypothetical protein SJAV_26070 [Sulfurisphaera javensis]|uniref:DUF234 domain-containing protein n=1 Tax=Sulfurisphaera javensis TaxID=2049879 RepID=A0AAT9GVK0_9CREN